ncbi:MAG: DUF4143 domain-containing protein [Spirochaetales bacterium]|nr:DUF4143 domain-containing protein [Spirochaetales bacterium]
MLSGLFHAKIDIRYNLKYWRTSDGKEVDFILEKDKFLLPIEVKTTWAPPKIPKGLLDFFDYYPETKQAIVFYSGKEQIIKANNRTIYFVPHYKASKSLNLLDLF